MKQNIVVSSTVIILSFLWIFCNQDKDKKDSSSLNTSRKSVDVVVKRTLKTGSTEHFQNPVFTADSKRIFFTSSNYNGIYYYDLSSEKLVKVNDAIGSGYQFVISKDGEKVYYRADAPMVKKRRRFMLYEQDVKSGDKKKLLKNPVRSLSTPQLINDHLIVCSLADSLKLINIAQLQDKSVQEVSLPYYQIQKNQLSIYKSGKKIYEKKYQDKSLLWPDFTKTGNKMIVYISGMGLNLIYPDKNDSRLLGDFRAAKWSPFENFIVYMHDVDDGEKILESDIFIYNLGENTSKNLTKTADVLEMYPDWSSDGKKIAYNTDKGKIEVLELRIK